MDPKIYSPFFGLAPLGKNQASYINRIRDSEPFIDQATPGFELGRKDLQSPALPLGHAAETIQNRWKHFFGGGLLNPLFLVDLDLESRFRYTFPKPKESPFLIGLDLDPVKIIFFG